MPGRKLNNGPCLTPVSGRTLRAPIPIPNERRAVAALWKEQSKPVNVLIIPAIVRGKRSIKRQCGRGDPGILGAHGPARRAGVRAKPTPERAEVVVGIK